MNFFQLCKNCPAYFLIFCSDQFQHKTGHFKSGLARRDSTLTNSYTEKMPLWATTRGAPKLVCDQAKSEGAYASLGQYHNSTNK